MDVYYKEQEKCSFGKMSMTVEMSFLQETLQKSDNIVKNIEYNVDYTFLEERQCCFVLTCAGLLLRQVKGAVRSLFNSSIEKPFGHLEEHGNYISFTTFVRALVYMNCLWRISLPFGASSISSQLHFTLQVMIVA